MNRLRHWFFCILGLITIFTPVIYGVELPLSSAARTALSVLTIKPPKPIDTLDALVAYAEANPNSRTELNTKLKSVGSKYAIENLCKAFVLTPSRERFKYEDLAAQKLRCQICLNSLSDNAWPNPVFEKDPLVGLTYRSKPYIDWFCELTQRILERYPRHLNEPEVCSWLKNGGGGWGTWLAVLKTDLPIENKIRLLESDLITGGWYTIWYLGYYCSEQHNDAVALFCELLKLQNSTYRFNDFKNALLTQLGITLPLPETVQNFKDLIGALKKAKSRHPLYPICVSFGQALLENPMAVLQNFEQWKQPSKNFSETTRPSLGNFYQWQNTEHEISMPPGMSVVSLDNLDSKRIGLNPFPWFSYKTCIKPAYSNQRYDFIVKLNHRDPHESLDKFTLLQSLISGDYIYRDTYKFNLRVKVYPKDTEWTQQLSPVYSEVIELPSFIGNEGMVLPRAPFLVHPKLSSWVREGGEWNMCGPLWSSYGLKTQLSYVFGNALKFDLRLSHRCDNDSYSFLFEIERYKWNMTKRSWEKVQGIDKAPEPFLPLYAISFSSDTPKAVKDLLSKGRTIGTVVPILEQPTSALNLRMNLSTSELEVRSTFDEVLLARNTVKDQVKRLGNNAMAIAAYVQNEIQLEDILGYCGKRKIISGKEALGAGPIFRSPTMTLLQGIGTPWEQCALLVTMLREAGHKAAFCTLDRTQSGKVPSFKVRRDKFLPMLGVSRTHSFFNSYDLQDKLELDFPWVVLWDSTESQWVHLFPWLKDVELFEGPDAFSYMPPAYDNAVKWVKAYLENDAAIMKHVGLDGNDTVAVLFESHLSEYLQSNGTTLSEVGRRKITQKHQYNSWEEFPHPDECSGSVRIKTTLTEPELFPTAKISIKSVKNQTRLLELPPMRIVDMYNRALYFYFESLSSNPNETRHNLCVVLSPIELQNSITGNFSGSLINRQSKTLPTDHTDSLFKITVEVCGAETRSEFLDKFSEVAKDAGIGIDRLPKYSDVYEPDIYEFVVEKGALTSICFGIGEFRDKMIQPHLTSFQTLKSQSALDALGELTYAAGLSYIEKCSCSNKKFQRWTNVTPETPYITVGLSKLSPANQKAGQGNLNPQGQFVGNPQLIYPQVDMIHHCTAFSLYTDEGEDKFKSNYYTMSIADGSSNEHQVINDFYNDKKAISTVKLIQLANRRSKPMLILDPFSFKSIAEDTTYQKAITELSDQWEELANAFQWDRSRKAWTSDFTLNPSWLNTLAFTTPGTIESDDLAENGIPSYKGAGTLLLTLKKWGAYISGNQFLMHGGYGSRLPSDMHGQVARLNIQVGLQKTQLQGLRTMYLTGNVGQVEQNQYHWRQVLERASQSQHLVAQVKTQTQPVRRVEVPSQPIPHISKSVLDYQTLLSQFERPPQVITEPPTSRLIEVVRPLGVVSLPVLRSEPKRIEVTTTLSPIVTTRPPEQNPVVRQYPIQHSTTKKPQEVLIPEAKPTLLGKIADPVSIVTGAFYQNEEEVGLEGLPRFSLCRNYNSLSPIPGDFGFGWQRNRIDRLYLLPEGSGDPELIHASEMDGTVVVYRKKGTEWCVQPEDNPGLHFGDEEGKNPIYNACIVRAELGYILTGGDGSKRSYRAIGNTPRLTEWRDTFNNAIAFEYAGEQLVKVTNGSGNFLTLTYTDDNISTVETSDGRCFSYAYDSYGDLVRVNLPEGFIDYTYAHETGPKGPYSTHWLTRIEKNGGEILENVYDANGRVLTQKVQDESGKLYVNASFSYLRDADENNLISEREIRDVFQNVTKYTLYNGMIAKVVDPLGHSIKNYWNLGQNDQSLPVYFDVDAGEIKLLPEGYRGFFGSLYRTVDKRGLAKTFQYDSNGNVASETIEGTDLSGESDGNTQAFLTQYRYDERNRCTEIRYSTGKKTVLTYCGEQMVPYKIENYSGTRKISFVEREYDTKGCLIQEIFGGKDPVFKKTYSYDTRGFPSQIVVHSNAQPGNHPLYTEKYTYNQLGQLLVKLNDDGCVTQYSYDILGRCTEEIVRDKSGKIVDSTRNRYDSRGYLQAQQGLLSYTLFGYDNAGRCLLKARPSDNVNISFQLGDNPVVLQSSPLDHCLPSQSVELFKYDKFGNMVLSSDAMGGMTERQYDALGRVQKIIVYDREDSRKVLSEKSFGYEPGGLISLIQKSNGKTIRRSYTTNGLLKEETHSDGPSYRWVYDAAGKVCRETSTAGGTWVYNESYENGIRKLEKKHLETGTTELYRYDFRDLLVEFVDAEGNHFHKTYDALGRVLTEYDPLNRENKSYRYYRENGLRVTTITNALGDICVIKTDCLGRKVSEQHFAPEQETPSYSLVVRYEELGVGKDRVLLEHWLEGLDEDQFHIIKIYGPNGRLRGTYNPIAANVVSFLGYNRAGECELEKQEETVRTFKHDTLGRQTREEVETTPGKVATTSFEGSVKTQTFAGTLQTITEKKPLGYKSITKGVKPETPPVEPIRQFEKKKMSPLTYQTVDADSVTHTVQLDNFGRIVSVEAKQEGSDTEIIRYTYDKCGRLTEVTNNNTRVARTYDAYGHILSEEVYLDDNLLYTAEQAFDGAGRRIQLIVNEEHTREFSYDSSGRLQEVSMDDNDIVHYEYNTAGLLKSKRSKSLYSVYNYWPTQKLWAKRVIATEGTPKQIFAARCGYDREQRLTGVITECGTLSEQEESFSYADGRLVGEKLSVLPKPFTYTYGKGLDLLMSVNDPLSESLQWGKAEDVELYRASWSAKKYSNSMLFKADNNFYDWTFGYGLMGHQTQRLEECKPHDSEGFLDQYRWDKFGQLNRVRRTYGNGKRSEWTAQYDGLGRRLKTTYREIPNDNLRKIETVSCYDPEVLFLEIGQTVQHGLSSHTIWKLYGADRTGQYASNQGWGTLEGVSCDEKYVSVVNNVSGDIAGYLKTLFDGRTQFVSLHEKFIRFNSRAKCDLFDANPGYFVDGYLSNHIWKGLGEDPTGLVWVGTRYYDPTFRRFISTDPMGHEGSWDLYSYANGDPINYWDPTGAFACKAYETTKATVQATGRFVAEHGDSIASTVSDFTPGVSTAKSIAEAVTGKDVFTGEKVSRAMALMGAVPLVGGIGKKAGVVAKEVKIGGQKLAQHMGEYSKVGGHHVYAKKAFEGHINYNPQKGFSISNELMKELKIDHFEVTNAQRRLFRELAQSGRPNTLREHTRIAVEALVENGLPKEQARSIVAEALKDLKQAGVRVPTNIPWHNQ